MVLNLGSYPGPSPVRFRSPLLIPAGGGYGLPPMRRLTRCRRMTPVETIDRELIKLVAAKHVAMGNLDYSQVSKWCEEIDELLSRRFALTTADAAAGLA